MPHIPQYNDYCSQSPIITSIYLIGSLRNRKLIELANEIEKELGIEVFIDWISPGEKTDDKWREYAKRRGQTYKQALNSYAAKHVFEYDKSHLDRCDAAVMVMPAGKSGHLELGYVRGCGKPGFILFDKEPKRWDVMVRFATDVFTSKVEMLEGLKKYVR